MQLRRLWTMQSFSNKHLSRICVVFEDKILLVCKIYVFVYLCKACNFERFATISFDLTIEADKASFVPAKEIKWQPGSVGARWPITNIKLFTPVFFSLLGWNANCLEPFCLETKTFVHILLVVTQRFIVLRKYNDIEPSYVLYM